MEKKQSSIEWVEQQFQTIIEKGNVEIENLIWQQAKAMHKEDVKESYREGRSDQQSSSDSFYNRNAESYYNETFGGE